MNSDFLSNLDDVTFDFDSIGLEATPSPQEIPNLEASRKKMVVFLVIDTSGSMKGERIGAVNNAMPDVIDMLAEAGAQKANVDIELALMTFDSDARWVTPMPEPVEEYTYRKITEPAGLTNVGLAFKKLDEVLSRDAFMKSQGGHYAPLLLLVTDGAPTDPETYPAALNKLKKNAWFKHSSKVVIAVESDATNPDALKMMLQFTGTQEGVVFASNAAQLAHMIQFVTMTSVDFNTRQESANREPEGADSSGEATSAVVGGEGSFAPELPPEIAEIGGKDIDWGDLNLEDFPF